MESIIYVGIDVHKDTYSLCSFNMQKDIFFSQHTMKASTANVASYLKKISESNGNAITVCGYEADPTGYRLCLDLQQQGFNCVIMTPTSIAKTAKDKILKTDRADARTTPGLSFIQAGSTANRKHSCNQGSRQASCQRVEEL